MKGNAPGEATKDRHLGEAGFEFVGITVAETAFGGNEIVAILKRALPQR